LEKAAIGARPMALRPPAQPVAGPRPPAAEPMLDRPFPAGLPVARAMGFGRGGGAWRMKGVAAEADEMAWGWAPVRQFPVPDYSRRREGPRTDFRETIYWNPEVATGKDGHASVKFFLSDAVTTFRATAEGRSAGGLPGRGDAVIQSKLPASLSAKVPL